MKIKKITSIIATSICAFSFMVAPLIGCAPAQTQPKETKYEIVDSSTYDWDSFKSPFEEMDLSYDEPNPDDVKMNIAMLSDIHLQIRDDHATRNFKRAVDTCVEMANGDLDAVAIVGDLNDTLWWNTVNYTEEGGSANATTNTNKNRLAEIADLRKKFDAIIPANTSLMYTIGNHDLCTMTGKFGVTYSSDQAIMEELAKVQDGYLNRDYFEYLQDGEEGEYKDSQPNSVQLREGLRYYRQNGVNFVILNANKFYSAYNCYTDGKINWLKRVLNYIRENHAGEPVLMITHQPVNNSVIGSMSTNHSLTLEPVLKDYPEVILFTGHIHQSNYHENAITQELGFTVVETSSTKYTDNSLYSEVKYYDIFNGSASSSSSQGLFVRVMKDNTVRISRIDFTYGKKSGKDWIVKPLGANGKNAIYTTDYREKHNTIPYFENAKVAIEYHDNENYTKTYTGKYLTIKFSPAVDNETIVKSYIVRALNSNGHVIKEVLMDSGYSAGTPIKMFSASFDYPHNIHKIEIYAEDAYFTRSLPIVIKKEDFGEAEAVITQTETYIGTSAKTGSVTANGITYKSSEAFVETEGVLNNYNTSLAQGNSYFDAFASKYGYSFKVSDMALGYSATTHGDASAEYRFGVNLATFEQNGLIYSFNGLFDFGTYNSNTRLRSNTNTFIYYVTVSGPSINTYSRSYSLSAYGLANVDLPEDTKDILKSSEGGVINVERNGSVFTIKLNGTTISTVDLKGDYYLGSNVVSFDENTKSTFGIHVRGAEAKFTNLTFNAQ